jgi:hypothetical protein
MTTPSDIIDDARKFSEADFRCAVRLLDAAGDNLDLAVRVVTGSNLVDSANLLLQRLEWDAEAARQLLILTKSFREILGVKKG